MRTTMRLGMILLLGIGMTGPLPSAQAQATKPGTEPAASLWQRLYTKREALIPMRDGVKLFTAIYTPKDASRAPYPILLQRTPYSVAPYGENQFPSRFPNSFMMEEGYIFVFQDVRGRYMSEGEFVDVRPHQPNKRTPKDIDESSDTYDTIEWLLNNVASHNGRVGMWGISYPGFYAATGMIDAHPALKAVSPQAPIADWYFDDFHHHGALFLPHAFNFLAAFGQPRPAPTKLRSPSFSHGTPDGYQFFLELGPLKNANEKHFKNRIRMWNDLVAHPDYDEFWQARNLLPHLKRVAPAVMTVGGWFDAEDLYGPLKIYRAVEMQNPGIFNILVMGPWRHGGWSRGDGDRLGNIAFGSKTSDFYREYIEIAFFNAFLKGKGQSQLPEAYVFETGMNRWRTFPQWPPAESRRVSFYFQPGGALKSEPPADEAPAFDEYVSDPQKPVPFTEAIAIGMTSEYMTDDQRFASRRPDVLVYQTAVLDRDLTLAGPLTADLWVSTSGTDSDWVVKLIDVFPNDMPQPPGGASRPLAGYQMMVRSEVLRGRYRNSYSKPEPFTPHEPARIQLELQDVLHTFRKGHRVMVQVQSTWFPLVDRNPQTFVPNIFLADETDFRKATQRVHRSKTHSSALRALELPPLAP